MNQSSQSQITRARTEMVTLLEQGQIVYETAQQILRLRDVVRVWIDSLGVEVEVDPNTPPELRDYLIGAGIGAVEGACKGALVGLLIGCLVRSPGTGLTVGAGLGAALGAVSGARAVESGYRVRIRAWDTPQGIAALVEVV